jgi:hypothetical protein
MEGNEIYWWKERRIKQEIERKVRCKEMISRRKSIQRKVDRRMKA